MRVRESGVAGPDTTAMGIRCDVSGEPPACKTETAGATANVKERGRVWGRPEREAGVGERGGRVRETRGEGERREGGRTR